MIAMGLLEVAGIGSILPFIAALANVDRVLENHYAQLVFNGLGFTDTRHFLLFLGALVWTLLIARNLFFALANWLLARFSFRSRQRLSERLLGLYLCQPYAYFLTRNTLELKRRISAEMERLFGRVIMPGLQVLTSAVISLFIIILLVVINPSVALWVALSLGGGYLLIYALIFRKLGRLGKKSNQARHAQFKIAGEAFEGIKELKLFAKEKIFLDNYSRWSRKSARLETLNRTLAQLPRYGIELLAVSGIMGFILYLVAAGRDPAPWLPLLVVYIVAGYRMLPALQKLFSGITSIQYDLSTLATIHSDLTGLRSAPATGFAQDQATGSHQPFGALRSIRLRDIDFRYPQDAHQALSGINLKIEQNTTVGLVGPTGSGKSTLVDILMGLLRAQSGGLEINSIAVDANNLPAWQQCIGYVPQHIFLFDDTLIRNVAMGVADEDIDHAALASALKTARLYDYVMNSLPAGGETRLGQRGIRLSGGQKQRIGIARALYRKPQVLVLDEATSALDGITESAVMDALQSLSHKLTIIMIAHRLNTVKSCDIIHYVEHGRIVCSGSYDQLSRSCDRFKQMIDRQI